METISKMGLWQRLILASGATSTITIAVTTTRTGAVINTVNVIATEHEPNMVDNTAIEEIVVSNIKIYLPTVLKKE